MIKFLLLILMLVASDNSFGALERLLVTKQHSKLDPIFHYELITNPHLKLEKDSFIKGKAESGWVLKTQFVENRADDYFGSCNIEYDSFILAKDYNVFDLLKSIKKLNLKHQPQSWSLDYLCLGRVASGSVLSRSILLSISQLINGTPYLSEDVRFNNSNITYYRLVEINQGYFFVCLDKDSFLDNSRYQKAKYLWMEYKLFTFNSASNLEITWTICNILKNLADKRSHLCLLDPLCGSGTMSFTALIQNMDVIANDVNKDFITGMKRNLESINLHSKFNPDKISVSCHVSEMY